MIDNLPDKPGEFVKRFGWYVAASAGPFAGALAVYIIYFVIQGQRISGSTDDWGKFSDFLMPALTLSLGLGNLFLLYLLTQIANKLQQKSLQKELVFDIYKDFITRIDDYSIQLLLNRSDQEKKRLYLSLIQFLVESAMANFVAFMNDDDKSSFENSVAALLKEVEQHFDEEKRSIIEYSKLVSGVKMILFKQTRN